jgi:hypothetical protein
VGGGVFGRDDGAGVAAAAVMDVGIGSDRRGRGKGGFSRCSGRAATTSFEVGKERRETEV